MSGNIYIFTNSYKPSLGGVQTVTSQLAESLSARGEKVMVVTQLSKKSFLPFSVISGVPVCRYHFEWKLSFIFLWMLFLLRKPAKVYVHFPEVQAPAVLWLKRHFDFRLITCFHGHDVLRYNEGYCTDSECFRAQYTLVHASDKVSACSSFLANVVEDIFIVRGVIPVYNGIDLKRYDRPVGESPWHRPYIFAFGRLERIKGYDMLIEAYSLIYQKHDCDLLIAGDGSQKEVLSRQINELGLKGKVHLIGRKHQEEIVQFTRHAELNVISSLREPFGIVALEAIASGRPIVATRAGGIPEIMSEYFGVLVDPTVAGLTGGIETVLENQDTFDFSLANEYLEQFSVDRMVNRYLSL